MKKTDPADYRFKSILFKSMMEQKVFRVDRARTDHWQPPTLSATNKMVSGVSHPTKIWRGWKHNHKVRNTLPESHGPGHDPACRRALASWETLNTSLVTK